MFLTFRYFIGRIVTTLLTLDWEFSPLAMFVVPVERRRVRACSLCSLTKLSALICVPLWEMANCISRNGKRVEDRVGSCFQLRGLYKNVQIQTWMWYSLKAVFLERKKEVTVSVAVKQLIFVSCLGNNWRVSSTVKNVKGLTIKERL